MMIIAAVVAAAVLVQPAQENAKMKITKGKLKKLIMEELARANLNEQEYPWYAKSIQYNINSQS